MAKRFLLLAMIVDYKGCPFAGTVESMQILFWTCFSLTVYTYFGYLGWLMVLERAHRRGRVAADLDSEPVQLPSISVVMAVRNECSRLEAKLKDFRNIAYPAELLEFIVVSDGSEDGSAALLEREASWLRPVLLARPEGKAGALNHAVREATGEVLVLCDVRQRLDSDAVAMLAAHFRAPTTGAVSGELLLEEADGSASADGLGLYWRIEKAVRRLESTTGSVVGVTGALYAVRRCLFPQVPPDTLLDDVYVPMEVARQGYRVLFEPDAKARDTVFAEPGKEFRRKVRTLTGNYQLVQKLPWLLSYRNPLLGRFISHKLLRLMVPLFLAGMLVASVADRGPLLHAMLGLQLVFYGLALVGAVWADTRRLKPVGVAYTFVLLNAAAVMAFRNFVAGRTSNWV